MQVPVFMRVGVYTFLVGLSIWSIWNGVERRDPLLVGVGIPFIILAAWGFSILRAVYSGANSIELANDAITFRMVPNGQLRMGWEAPNFGLRLTETSMAVNRASEPSIDHATYRIFTGTGSGVGPGPRVLSEVPLECVRAILLESIARKLSVVEGREGVAGTVSERRTWKVTAGPPALGYPPSIP